MFISKQHQQNFLECAVKWPQIRKGNTEYCSAAYIFAIPTIFEKFSINKVKTPVSWIIDWEFKFNDKTSEMYGMPQSERDEIIINYDLTNSMVQLGRLALHLWNSYNEFHLLDCLAAQDEMNYLAATNAIHIRFAGTKKNIEMLVEK